MALTRSAATTDESTPPESASSTLPFPTCARTRSIWSAMKFFMFQLASAWHVSNSHFRSHASSGIAGKFSHFAAGWSIAKTGRPRS